MGVGALWGSAVSFDPVAATFAGGGFTSQAFATLNNGWSARFQAKVTNNILSVNLAWGTVSSPGTVRVRIETSDPTTGLPTGTLYDANATVDITPAAGWQTCTFATPPTTGLTVGNEYHVVLLVTVGGTTQNLRYVNGGTQCLLLPLAALFATNGTTRSNFAEVTNAIPIVTLGLSGGGEEVVGFGEAGTSNATISSTNGHGAKITLLSPVKVAGVQAHLTRTGASPGDLRARIYDSNGSVVATTMTASGNSLKTQTVSARRVLLQFASVVTLPAGTYRVMLDLPNAEATGYLMYYLSTPRSTVSHQSGYMRVSATGMNGTPAFTDTSADYPMCGLFLDDQVATGPRQVGFASGGFTG